LHKINASCGSQSDDTKNSFYEELDHVSDQFLKYHMKVVLHLNVKVRREDIFEPTIGNDSLHGVSDDNLVRVVNFATLKIVIAKSTVFLNRDIRKCTWTFS
jgi:hypothetical protein